MVKYCSCYVLAIVFNWLLASGVSACPADLPSLISALLPDLPNYLNRAYTRAGVTNRFVITTNSPEFEPLPVVTEFPNQVHPQQVFVSVLEKPKGNHPPYTRAYWLFFSRVPATQWQLAMAFARVGNAPPTDVSDSTIATAVNTWLRDHCGDSF
jgi:hypothetical protein